MRATSLLLATLSATWLLTDALPARAAAPLVADPAVHWEQVGAKARKKAPVVEEDDDDADADDWPPPAAVKKKPAKRQQVEDLEEDDRPRKKSKRAREEPRREAPADAVGIQRELGDYLGYGFKGLIPFVIITEPYAREVREKIFFVNCLAPCLAPFGGYIWLPKAMYGEPPKNQASDTAFKLGLMATGLAWLPCVGCWFYWVPVVGWGLFFLIEVVMHRTQYAVMGRAINLAYSDAFGGPEGNR